VENVSGKLLQADGPRIVPRSSVSSVLLVLLVFWGLPGRLPAGDNPFELQRISTDQGLSEGSVAAILQDYQGFLWIGTGNGLNLFDGYSFRVFKHRPSDPDSLSDNHIQSLLEEKAGGVWIGTFQGLNLFDRKSGRFQRFLHDPDNLASLSHNQIEVIHQDAAGGLWIGTRQGLNRFDPSTERFSRPFVASEGEENLAQAFIRAILEDRAGNLWIGTDRPGLTRLDPEQGRWRTYRGVARGTAGVLRNAEGPADDSILWLHQDQAGLIWIASRAGLSSFDPETEGFRQHRLDPSRPEPLGVQTIHQDGKGVLWIGTATEGLFHFQPGEAQPSQIKHDPTDSGSLSSNRIAVISEDASGNLWIGTEGGGLNKLVRRHKSVELVRRDPQDSTSLPSSRIRSVFVDSRQVLWVGTEGGLWSHHPDGEEGDSLDLPELRRARVSAIAEDPAGDLWFGTKGDGLVRWQRDGGSLTRFPFKSKNQDGRSHGEVSALLVDGTGTLWVGTHGGLHRFDRGSGIFYRYQHESTDPNSLSNNRVTAIHQDHKENLWIGTYVGLNRLDPQTGSVRRYARVRGQANTLSDNRIWSIYERSPGELYLGTSGGLNRLDVASGEVTRIARERQDPRGNRILGILGDEEGNIWLSSNRGISRFDPATESFTDYGVKDGLQGSEFNPGVFFKSPQGEMFFGGDGGLNRFYPGRLKDQRRAPAVVLTAFKKFNREEDFGGLAAEVEELYLTHKDYFISFEFAALDFTNSQENRYAYRLAGFDTDWVDIGNKSSATYTSLPAGDYTFQVKGASRGGVWNEEGLAIRVHMAAPFWQRWWFRLGALLAVLGLGTLMHQLRTRGIQEKNKQLEKANVALEKEVELRQRAEEEKQEFIAELKVRNAEMERFTYTVSHDLKSPLITILSFMGLIEQDLALGKAERVGNSMQRVHRAAEKMGQLLDDLLALSRIGRVVNPPQEVSMSALVHEVAELLSGRIRAGGVTVDVAPDLPSAYGDALRLEEVVQNLMENAIKFTAGRPGARVEVGYREGGEETIFTIQDNGIGIDPKYHQRVFKLFERLDPTGEGTGIGLALIKRIIQVHGGRIWVESEGEGCGSTFCFTLPREALTPR